MADLTNGTHVECGMHLDFMIKNATERQRVGLIAGAIVFCVGVLLRFDGYELSSNLNDSWSVGDWGEQPHCRVALSYCRRY